MNALPDLTPALVNFVAIRLAETTAKDWKEMPAETKKAHRAKARRLLTAERKFLEKHPDGGAAGAAASEA
ncbi:hypothetical protein [Lutibaculum baratangense]|uniref:Uncharacterized protein n=1 Tax=Lutibaculum baratangense AMV1 TaxID=631454 RepID=V4RJH9_9HYPH|nr:hypothetical protein [Lutibaculum baratangense]ESR26256.1 hypothetical protein N177_1115 [Lutibaculum baratangense AMV1]